MWRGIKNLRYFWVIVFWSLFLVISGCGVSADCKLEEVEKKVMIYFFHDTACGSCDGTKEFRELVTKQLEPYKQSCPYELFLFNIFKNNERENAAAILSQYDVEIGSLYFPVVMVNGRIYEGMEAIQQNLKAEFLGQTELKALYFYRDDCDECNQLKPYLDSLPDEVAIDGENIPFRLDMLASRSGNNGEILRQFFIKWNVPEEKQMVPFMILGDQYLAGIDDIQENLLSMLEQGYGIGISDYN